MMKFDDANDEVHDNIIEIAEIGNALGWTDEDIAQSIYNYLAAAFPQWNATRH
jgi:hypothetical protein